MNIKTKLSTITDYDLDISNIKGNGFDIDKLYIHKNALWMDATVTDPGIKYMIENDILKDYQIKISFKPLPAIPLD